MDESRQGSGGGASSDGTPPEKAVSEIAGTDGRTAESNDSLPETKKLREMREAIETAEAARAKQGQHADRKITELSETVNRQSAALTEAQAAQGRLETELSRIMSANADPYRGGDSEMDEALLKEMTDLKGAVKYLLERDEKVLSPALTAALKGQQTTDEERAEMRQRGQIRAKFGGILPSDEDKAIALFKEGRAVDAADFLSQVKVAGRESAIAKAEADAKAEQEKVASVSPAGAGRDTTFNQSDLPGLDTDLIQSRGLQAAIKDGMMKRLNQAYGRKTA